MRIPSNRLQHSMIHALNGALGRIQRTQVELATGRRLLKPSDDPAGTMRVLSYQKSMAENQQYLRNTSDGLRWVTSTEDALMQLTELLAQIKEIATRGASATSGSDRSALGTQVDALLGEMIDLARTRTDDRYVFSGFNTSTAPILTSTSVEDEVVTAGAVGVAVDLEHAQVSEGTVVVTDATGTTTYVEGVDYTIDYSSGRLTVLGGAISEGDSLSVDYETSTVSSVEGAEDISGAIVRQVAPDRTVTVNMLCTDVFQGSVDLFQLTVDLKNALWKDDGDSTQALLESISGAINLVTEKLGAVGARARSLESQQLRLESDEITLEGFISEIEDVDLTSAVVRLEAEQLAYESALAATARLMQISITNYL